MNTRLSDGFEMSVSTWSWVLLQNEHLRISSSSWRLENISPVCRGSGGSQDSRRFKWRGLSSYGFTVAAKHRKMLHLDAERLLALGHLFSQIKLRHWFCAFPGAVPTSTEVLQLQGWAFGRVSGWDFAGHLYSASASSPPRLSLRACGGIFGSH